MVCNTTIEEIFDEFGGTYETHILGRYKKNQKSSMSTFISGKYYFYWFRERWQIFHIPQTLIIL